MKPNINNSMRNFFNKKGKRIANVASKYINGCHSIVAYPWKQKGLLLKQAQLRKKWVMVYTTVPFR